MDFRNNTLSNLFQKITSTFTAKRYVGLINNNVPVKTKNWGSNDFLTANEISLYTNRALAKRSQKIGEVQFELHKPNGDVIENDPLINLLYKPNKVFTGPQFWKLAQLYYDTVGEVYILLTAGEREIFEAKRVGEMHLLMPTRVKPKFGKDGQPTAYVYKTDKEEITYNPEEIIYWHNPNPRNPLRGSSLLQAGIHAIQTETQISTYHSSILQNGGKVEGVFKFNTQRLKEEQIEKLEDQYKKKYAEAKRAGRPLFLAGDAEYIRTGLNPEELSFLEAKKTTLEDICILTGVPKSMLASTNDVKFDNAEADRAIFLRETIRPLLVELTTVLDERLFPDDRNLTFVDPTPENIEEKRKNIETANKINAITTNEKRELLSELGMELDELKEGNEILVPFNLAPLGSEKETPAPAKSKDNKEIEHPLRDAELRKVYGRVAIKRADAREKTARRHIRKYIDDQRDRLIEKLQERKNATGKQKQLIDEVFNLELEVKAGKEALLPVLTEMLKEAGVDALDFMESDAEFTVTPDITSWVDNRANIFLTSINETTLEQLRKDFEDSLIQEEGREELIARIQNTYGGIKKRRAGVIARTEVHGYTQNGTLEGYKQGGLKIKIWVAVQDTATRDSHSAADGEERPIDATFSNGLLYPGDSNGPAGETINCRCVI